MLCKGQRRALNPVLLTQAPAFFPLHLYWLVEGLTRLFGMDGISLACEPIDIRLQFQCKLAESLPKEGGCLGSAPGQPFTA